MTQTQSRVGGTQARLWIVLVALVALLGSGANAAAAQAAETVTPVLRINAGGGVLTDSGGKRWEADRGHAGGAASSMTRAVAGTEDDALYQKYRYAMGSYAFVVPNGEYQVRLHTAETYWNASGKRVFDVLAEGVVVDPALDVHARSGRDRALVRTYRTTVRDGRLDVTFRASKDNALVAGIEVLRVQTAQPMAVGSQFHCMWSGSSGYGTFAFDATRGRVLDKLKAAGVRSVRIDVGWDGLQPQAGVLPDASNWYVKLLDSCVDQARVRGLDVMLTLDRSPAWARPSSHAGTARVLPADPRSIRGVAGWLSGRYKGKVTGIEVWNEPNLKDFVQVVDPVKYVAVLGQAHASIKAANPEMLVVFSGADRVAVKPGGSVVDDFYSRAYAAGARGKFDVMAVHTYQGPSDAPASAPDEGTWRITHMPALLRLMAANGDGSKPVWVTEFGWSVHTNNGSEPTWARGVSEAQQAAYTKDALRILRSYPQVQAAYVYSERQKATGDRHQDGYGLLRRDLSERPALWAVRDSVAGR